MSERRGYEIGSKFYPAIPVNEWTHGDCALVREITRIKLEDFFAGKADGESVTTALTAVALAHAQPELQMDKIVAYLYAQKLGAITEVGFEEEVEPDPPAEGADGETKGSGSSASSEPSPASNPEPSAPSSSGSPGSDTGSPESPPE